MKQLSGVLTSLIKSEFELITGEFQGGQIYVFAFDEADVEQFPDELLSTIEDTVGTLFEKFYEEEELDIDDFYGSFELIPEKRKLTLTLHLETDEEIALSFPFCVEEFTVLDRKIIFNFKNIVENPSLLLTEGEKIITSVTQSDFEEMLKNELNRITFYTVGVGGDGYSSLYSFTDNITIVTDKRYDWDFSDEVEAIFIAIDFEIDSLRVVKEIEF